MEAQNLTRKRYICIHLYIDGIFWNTGTLWTIVLWHQGTFQLAAKCCLARSGVEPRDSHSHNSRLAPNSPTTVRNENATEPWTKKSEWRILWGADGLNTSDLREWRNVCLALAIIIVLWYFLWNWNADTLWTTVVWHQDTFQLSAKSYKKITLNNNASVYPKRTFYMPKSIIDIPVTCKWTFCLFSKEKFQMFLWLILILWQVDGFYLRTDCM